MTNKRTRLSAAIPVAARRRFDTHPATQGAGRAEYFALVEDVFAALQPQDVIEFILIKPIVDNTWQIESLRGVEVALLSSHALDVIVEALQPRAGGKAGGNHGRPRMLGGRLAGDMGEEEAARRKKELEEFMEAARRRVRLEAEEAERKRRQILPQAVPMRAYLQHSGNLERIGRMIAQAEARIRTALRELERYRADRRLSTDWPVRSSTPNSPNLRSSRKTMTSQRQWETNRRNARASSGPRTAAGKGRSSQNALRHGLAVRVSQHPALVQEATVRAAEIARAVGDQRSHADALILGEAEIELSRVRMVQQDLLSRAFAALAEDGCRRFRRAAHGSGCDHPRTLCVGTL